VCEYLIVMFKMIYYSL